MSTHIYIYIYLWVERRPTKGFSGFSLRTMSVQLPLARWDVWPSMDFALAIWKGRTGLHWAKTSCVWSRIHFIGIHIGSGADLGLRALRRYLAADLFGNCLALHQFPCWALCDPLGRGPWQLLCSLTSTATARTCTSPTFLKRTRALALCTLQGATWSSLPTWFRMTSSAPSSPTAADQVTHDSFIPLFTGRPEDYKEWRKRIHIYHRKMTLSKRMGESLLNIIGSLTGTAWRLVEDYDLNDVEKPDSFDRLIKLLDVHFEYDSKVQLPSDFDGYFTMSRRSGQTLLSYVTEHGELHKKLERHGVSLPNKVQGWFLLRQAGLTREQRQLVTLKAPGLEVNKITLYLLFGQDYKSLAAPPRDHRWHRAGKGRGYAAMDEASDWPDDATEWDAQSAYYEASWDEAYYEDEETYDPEESFDYDAGYYEGEGQEDDGSPIHDVEAYDEAYAAYLDARKRFSDLKLARGYLVERKEKVSQPPTAMTSHLWKLHSLSNELKPLFNVFAVAWLATLRLPALWRLRAPNVLLQQRSRWHFIKNSKKVHWWPLWTSMARNVSMSQCLTQVHRHSCAAMAPWWGIYIIYKLLDSPSTTSSSTSVIVSSTLEVTLKACHGGWFGCRCLWMAVLAMPKCSLSKGRHRCCVADPSSSSSALPWTLRLSRFALKMESGNRP